MPYKSKTNLRKNSNKSKRKRRKAEVGAGPRQSVSRQITPESSSLQKKNLGKKRSLRIKKLDFRFNLNRRQYFGKWDDIPIKLYV